jgi:hypothetical protein
MNPEKLQCLTTACWLRGYADTLDKDNYSTLIYRMKGAADLLEKTWAEYAEANGYGDIKILESKT